MDTFDKQDGKTNTNGIRKIELTYRFTQNVYTKNQY